MEGRATTVVRITRLIKQKNFRYGSLKVWAGVDFLAHSRTRDKADALLWFSSTGAIKKRPYGLNLKVWAGVDSNHRSLATADLQSAPFSLSGTYPYSIFKKCL